MCLLVFTIELFYRLAATWQPQRLLFAVALSGLILSLIALFVWPTTRLGTRHIVYCKRFLFLFILIISGVYGVFRGANEVVSVPFFGQPLYVAGTVTAIHHKGTLSMVDVSVRQVETDRQVHPCRMDIYWISRANKGVADALQVGDKVTLSGVLVLPSEHAKPSSKQGGTAFKDSPLMSYLMQSYSFRGRLLTDAHSVATNMMRLQATLQQSAIATCPNRFQADIPLLESVVFGGNQVSTSLHKVFLQAGVLHVLAASGANILLVERVLNPALRLIFGWIPYGRWFARLSLLLFVWLFSMLCGVQPSILRAAWMSTYRICGECVGRKTSCLSSLLFSALCMAIFTPAMLWSVSSILSFVATFAIDRVIHLPRGRRRPNHRHRRVRHWLQKIQHSLRMTCFVELYTAPMCDALFMQWTPFAIVSNLLVEPILEVLLPSSLCWLIVCWFGIYIPSFHQIARWVAPVVFIQLSIMLHVLQAISRIPGSLVETSVPSIWWFAAYYFLLISAPMLWSKLRAGTLHKVAHINSMRKTSNAHRIPNFGIDMGEDEYG